MSGRVTRRALVAAGASAAVLPRAARAQQPKLRLGVLTDLTGPYSLTTGAGAIHAAEMAVADFAKTGTALPVEVIGGDGRSNEPVSRQIATDWLDKLDVSLILDVPGSDSAETVAALVRDRDRAAIFSGAGSTRLTGRLCSPNHIHWTYDTWSLAHGTGATLVENGGKKWFFITADYEFGHRLEEETTNFILAAGGEVVGTFPTPFPCSDFSDAIVQAVASGADVIGLANAGADTIGCIRQAAAFGLTAGGQKLAALLFQAADVHAVGLDEARGLVTTEAFYWDRDDATRAFSDRFVGERGEGKPSMDQAGVYAATLHYLHAVAAMGVDAARASGRAVIAQMKAMPADGPLFGRGSIRPDGRKIHDMYLYQVKTPMQARSPWDVYIPLSVIPAAQAFRPMAEGNCPMLRG